MRYLLDKLSVGSAQWRLFADSSSDKVWVVNQDNVYEFANRTDAYHHAVAEYRKVADMRSMQPGQSYSLTMQDGTTKTVQVQSQTPEGVQVLDPNSGQTMMIPHVQPGADPKPAQPSSGGVGTSSPKPNQTPNQAATPVSPENVTDRTYSLGINDLRVRASEYGRTPYKCQHDNTYLNRKNPSDPEKFCPDCGMVYAASKKKDNPAAERETEKIKVNREKNTGPHKFEAAEWTHPNGHPRCIKCGAEEPISGRCGGYDKAERHFLHSRDTFDLFDRTAVITGGPGSYHVKSEEGKNLGGPYKTREQAEHRLKQVEYFKHKGSKEAATFSPFDEPAKFPGGQPKVDYRPYRCMNCGKEKMISTNHQGKVIDYCEGCSWKPSFGKAEYAVPGPGGRTYRPFEYAGPTSRTVLQSRKDAKIISEESECVNCGSTRGTLNDNGLCAKCARRKAFHLWKNRERIVHAFDLIKQADAPMPGQQAMPSAETSNMGETLKMDEKSPGEFAEEPESDNPQNKMDPNAKRKLTPHEIIEEAESLIRNALVKGVKIGASELGDYMTQYYNNSPDELMNGIALAWQKVQYEESMEGPGSGTPDGQGFGPKAPTTPEEAEQMAPTNGPIRTRELY